MLPLDRAGRDLRERDVLEGLRHVLVRAHVGALGDPFECAPKHVHRAGAAGDETHRDLDETGAQHYI